MKTRFILFAACFFLTPVAQANDFPTIARVEYVFKCMNEHGGQNYTNLYKCACSIDEIAERLSYGDYAEAETYTQLRSLPGEQGGVFRDPPRADELRNKLAKTVQEAEASCFL